MTFAAGDRVVVDLHGSGFSYIGQGRYLRGTIRETDTSLVMLDYLVEFDDPTPPRTQHQLVPRACNIGETPRRRWMSSWAVARLSILDRVAEAAQD